MGIEREFGTDKGAGGVSSEGTESGKMVYGDGDEHRKGWERNAW